MTEWKEPYDSPEGISVPKAGFDVQHSADHTIDRPHGFHKDYIFICFHTSITIYDPHTDAIRSLDPGACIFYSPGVRQWYRAAKEHYRHSWFHAIGHSVPKTADRYRISLDRVVYPHSTADITRAIHRMALELNRQPSFWKESIQIAFEECLMKLARGLSEKPFPRKNSEPYKRLLNIREELRSGSETTSVTEMARKACLSRTRFSVLYREFFGISPMQDILDTKIERAAWLLSQGQLSVKQVCAEIGYDDPAYFSRLFKKRIGVAPSRYRYS